MQHLCCVVEKRSIYIKSMTKKLRVEREARECDTLRACKCVNVCVCDRNNVGDDVIDVTTFSVAGNSIHTQNILRKVVFLCVVLGLCCVNGNW